jgi:hypothetical protein
MLTFLASLTTAYIRVATTVNNNQTGHTLAVVMLFSCLIFAVYISGHVGIFKDPRLAIQTLANLNDQYPELFPAPDSDIVPAHPSWDFKDRYIDASNWVGGNNSWRPDKTLVKRNPEERSSGLIFSLSIFPPLVSWAAAFLLSYFTPLVGVGCRAASWTLILFLWIVSALTDWVSWKTCKPSTAASAKWLWRVMMFKDFIVVAVSVALVAMAQIGFFNRCWCMASVFVHRAADNPVCIDLGPVSQEARDYNWRFWLVIPLLGLLLIYSTIIAAGWEGERGRLLYLRTDNERRIEAKFLAKIGLEDDRGSIELDDFRDRGGDSTMVDSGRKSQLSAISTQSLSSIPPSSSIQPRLPASQFSSEAPVRALTSSTPVHGADTTYRPYQHRF